MIKILEIKKWQSYYEAVTPQGEIIFGSPANAGGVDGTDASAVIQAAINYADIIDARLLEVTKNE